MKFLSNFHRHKEKFLHDHFLQNKQYLSKGKNLCHHKLFLKNERMYNTNDFFYILHHILTIG